jgi:guanylate kinase
MIVLVGKTCSGKTTILNELEKLGIERIVTMTTRPMRPGEIEGKTYYYRTEEEFKKLMDYGFFAETTSYKVANGETWWYGTPKEKLCGDGAIILNPDGLHALKDKFKMLVFYLDVPDHILLKRLNERGDKKGEANRRLAADNEDFKNIQDDVDWIIGDYWSSPIDIAHKIKKKYEIWRNL